MDKAPAGTRIAIFGLTERLDMLQGFTTRLAVLKSALTMTEGADRGDRTYCRAPVNGGYDGRYNHLRRIWLGGAHSGGRRMLTQDMIDDIKRFQALTDLVPAATAREVYAGRVPSCWRGIW